MSSTSATAVSSQPARRTSTYQTGTDGIALTASYAEIRSVVRAEEKPAEAQPFQVGEVFTCSRWNREKGDVDRLEFRIIRATDKSVTIQTGDESRSCASRRRLCGISRASGVCASPTGTTEPCINCPTSNAAKSFHTTPARGHGTRAEGRSLHPYLTQSGEVALEIDNTFAPYLLSEALITGADGMPRIMWIDKRGVRHTFIPGTYGV